LNQHFLVCGSTGSGKTQMLLNYIYQTSRPKNGTFKQIILVYKTYEPLYKWLADQLEDKLILINDLSQLPECQEFKDADEKTKHQILLIFDDCINDVSKKEIQKVRNYFTFGRKKNITICFLSQSFFQTDIFVRKQCSFIILCSIRGNRDLTSILKDFSIGDIDKSQLMDMYEFAIEKESPEDAPNFFKICTSHCAKNKKFSKNFLDYLDPDQHCTCSEDAR